MKRHNPRRDDLLTKVLSHRQYGALRRRGQQLDAVDGVELPES